MFVNIADGCIGCGLCQATCDSVFSLSDSGYATVISQPTPEEENAVREASESCPVSVIEISM